MHQVGFIYQNVIQSLWPISLAECQGRALSHEVQSDNKWQGMEPVCLSGRWRCFVWRQQLQIMQKLKSFSPTGSLLTYPFIWTEYETEFKYVTGLYEFMNSTSVDSWFSQEIFLFLSMNGHRHVHQNSAMCHLYETFIFHTQHTIKILIVTFLFASRSTGNSLSFGSGFYSITVVFRQTRSTLGMTLNWTLYNTGHE